ncbi:MAG: Ig-like domain-containing protein, partial [Christensenellales bacterium]
MLRRYVEINMNTCSGVVNKISKAVLLILLIIGLVGGVCLWDIPAAYAEGYEGSEGGEDPLEATGIVLDQTELELLVGDSQLLTVTATPEGAACPDITWSTSDENVATVDADGLVTAKAEGTAQISFTASAFTGVCEVTVRSPFTVT